MHECRRCTECEGEEHHWGGYFRFKVNDRNHPAAIAGHEAWEVCKHCEAWRPVPEIECGWCGVDIDGIDVPVELDGEHFCSQLCLDQAREQEGSFNELAELAEA